MLIRLLLCFKGWQQQATLPEMEVETSSRHCGCPNDAPLYDAIVNHHRELAGVAAANDFGDSLASSRRAVAIDFAAIAAGPDRAG